MSTAPDSATALAEAVLAAPTTRAQVTGLGIMLLVLGTGIFVGLRSKSLKMWELIVCGSFGLLLGSTDLAGPPRSFYGAAGSWLLSLVA